MGLVIIPGWIPHFYPFLNHPHCASAMPSASRSPGLEFLVARKTHLKNIYKMGKSSVNNLNNHLQMGNPINGDFSIAMFEYRRVSPTNQWANLGAQDPSPAVNVSADLLGRGKGTEGQQNMQSQRLFNWLVSNVHGPPRFERIHQRLKPLFLPSNTANSGDSVSVVPLAWWEGHGFGAGNWDTPQFQIKTSFSRC